MQAEALVHTLPVRPILPEPVPEPVKVPEAEGYEDEDEADVFIVVVVVVTIPPITGPEMPVLVPTVPVTIVRECRRDGHEYHHEDGEGQEHDSTHKLPPCSRVLSTSYIKYKRAGHRILRKEDLP
jgi:hypothetical protein